MRLPLDIQRTSQAVSNCFSRFISCYMFILPYLNRCSYFQGFWDSGLSGLLITAFYTSRACSIFSLKQAISTLNQRFSAYLPCYIEGCFYNNTRAPSCRCRWGAWRGL